MEIFKEIVGFEMLYAVSNYGRIYSFKNDRILKGKITKDNYRQVTLHKNNVGKSYYIHTLVAKAFIPNPNNYKEINHINHDTLDNRVCNLEWSNRILQCDEIWKEKQKIKSKSQEIKVGQYDLYDNLINIFPSMTKAGKYFNCSGSDISSAIRKNHLSHGFKWKIL